MSDPSKAVDHIYKVAKDYAEAKSNRVYLEQFRKSKKAILFSQAPSEFKTIQDKESYAYAHDDYVALLEGLKQAVFIEEKLRYELVAAQLRVEVWRTQEASSRFIDRNQQ